VTEFYRQYLAVAVFIAAALLMVGVMLGVGRLLRPTRPQPEKYISYESGSDPIGGWGQSNVRYYVYALLFVMFDVEAVFVFPWAVQVESLTIVIVGITLVLVCAWRKGVLKWA
jgi:NADH-quinone oxidoreductase subunit A